MVIIIVSLIVLVCLVTVFYQLAPSFTTYLILLIIAAFSFMLSEQWKTHDAAEFENRFWTLLAACLSFTCFFCKDSPLRFSEGKEGIAWCIVILCTYLCHIFDRDVRRTLLLRPTPIRKQRSADFNVENRAQAKLKVVELKKLVGAIDLKWVSSTFLNLFFLPHVLSAEDQIVSILSEANADELNLILGDDNFELALILYKVKDHWVSKRYHRTKLLELLAKERIHDLNIRSRATLVDGIQRLKLSAHPKLEQFVKHIFCETRGDELSELKNLTDSKGDINTMHHLMFVSLRDRYIQQSMLEHFAAQARIQQVQTQMGGHRGRRRNILAWRKVLSDVDDTLTCSGGSWPKGMDRKYPKHSIYPGILAFYRELDLGNTSGPDDFSVIRPGNLVFLSARPHVYRDIAESATYAKLRDLQETRGLHSTPTLLAGSLDTGTHFFVTEDLEPLAKKKYDNLREYLRIYPEFSWIFIGDNGQGDVRAVEMILQNTNTTTTTTTTVSSGKNNDITTTITTNSTVQRSIFEEKFQRSYIHLVQPVQQTHVQNSQWKTYQDTSSLYYFSTYIDAAMDAFHRKLIRITGLQRLMQEAVRDFYMIDEDHWKLMNPESIPSANPCYYANYYKQNPKRSRGDSFHLVSHALTTIVGGGHSNTNVSTTTTTNNNVKKSVTLVNNNNNKETLAAAGSSTPLSSPTIGALPIPIAAVTSPAPPATVTHPTTINNTMESPSCIALPTPVPLTAALDAPHIPPSSCDSSMSEWEFISVTNVTTITTTAIGNDVTSTPSTTKNAVDGMNLPPPSQVDSTISSTTSLTTTVPPNKATINTVPTSNSANATSIAASAISLLTNPFSPSRSTKPSITTSNGTSQSLSSSTDHIVPINAPTGNNAPITSSSAATFLASFSLTSRSNNTPNPHAVSTIPPINLPARSVPIAALTFSLSEHWQIGLNRPATYYGHPNTTKKTSGLCKRELRIRELNVAIEKANMILKQHRLDSVDSITFPCLYEVGKIVKTMFGIGQIVDFRERDGIYNIFVPDAKYAYLLHDPSHVSASTTSNHLGKGSKIENSVENESLILHTESTATAAGDTLGIGSATASATAAPNTSTNHEIESKKGLRTSLVPSMDQWQSLLTGSTPSLTPSIINNNHNTAVNLPEEELPSNIPGIHIYTTSFAFSIIPGVKSIQRR
jgi:hypothetical protein